MVTGPLRELVTPAGASWRGKGRARRRIGGSAEASEALGHVPAPPSPTQSGPFCSHSVADAPPLAALMDAKLRSGDKCSNRSPRPTRAFNRDARRRLLAPPP